ncbi:hypothetical protein P4209_06220 [Pseudomonas aeruginosa]|nr:hypothetical protein [Pseudomonas aeruginosa]MDF5926278.1 hypothetical protein [Pseudomonas aeruginosa]
MARYDHLRLIRIPQELPRRKKPGFGKPVTRDRGDHSARLNDELAQAVAQQAARKRPGIVDPSLILRVRMTEALLEESWHGAGLELLSSDPDKTLVLFPLMVISPIFAPSSKHTAEKFRNGRRTHHIPSSFPALSQSVQ